MQEDEDQVGVVQRLQDIERRLPLLLRPRKRVSASSLDAFLSSIDHFLELPTLLNPILESTVHQVAKAFLQSLEDGPRLSDAAAQIMYTLCKVRGRKVITNLLPNETHRLSPLLNALTCVPDSTWAERYFLFLWLGHLMLLPFDLRKSNVSSGAQVEGFPLQTPKVAQVLINHARNSLDTASRDRDAAAILLARIALRTDSVAIGLDKVLVDQAIRSIVKDASTNEAAGLLRFLLTYVKAAERPQLQPLLHRLEKGPQDLVLKIHAYLLKPAVDECADEVDGIVSNFIDALASQDTRVRLTAAKCIAITVSSMPSAASAVLDAIVETLGADDLASWHGGLMCFAHLGLKRAIPSHRLTTTITLLLRGLEFDQRTLYGVPAGANVRDAAVCGLYLALKKYRTSELLACDIPAIVKRLLSSACLDPVSNVRRGASAAFQEMVGRHSDHVPGGIQLVQLVDYTAVSSRKGYMLHVAVQLAAEFPEHRQTIIQAMLGWRGSLHPDVRIRRMAAASLGSLAERGLIDNLSIDEDPQQGRLLALAAVISAGIQTSMGGLSNIGPPCLKGTSDLFALEARAAYIAALAQQHDFEQSILTYKGEIIASLARTDPLDDSDELQNRCNDALAALVSVMPLKARAWFSQELLNAVQKDLTTTMAGRKMKGLLLAWSLTSTLLPEISVASLLQLLCQIAKQEDLEVEVRGTAFLSLSRAIRQCTKTCMAESSELIVRALIAGLDDRTSSFRGDVGSLVRMAAVQATAAFIETDGLSQMNAFRGPLIANLCRLLTDKLDKVRSLAADVFEQCKPFLTSKDFDGPGAMGNTSLTFCDSEVSYYGRVLALRCNARHREIRSTMLQSYVLLTVDGPQNVCLASRRALHQHLEDMPDANRDAFLAELETQVGANRSSRFAICALEVLGWMFDARLVGNAEWVMAGRFRLTPDSHRGFCWFNKSITSQAI